MGLLLGLRGGGAPERTLRGRSGEPLLVRFPIRLFCGGRRGPRLETDALGGIIGSNDISYLLRSFRKRAIWLSILRGGRLLHEKLSC